MRNSPLKISKQLNSRLPDRASGAWYWLAVRLVRAGAWSATAVTLASLFGQFSWIAELFTHFRLQMAAGTLLVAGLAALVRMHSQAVLLAVLAVTNAAFLADYVLPGTGKAQPQTASLRLLSLNVSRRNVDFSALHTLIDEMRPDVVGLMEVNNAWLESLRYLEPAYPYRILRPQDGYFGLAILSRLPLRELDWSPLAFEEVQTAIVAELTIGEQPVTLVLSHVQAPLTPTQARSRNRQLESLAEIFRENPHGEGILLGDLNITPWSPYFATLETETELLNAARGEGYRGTWPVQPFIFRIPIDHCLLSAGFQVRRIRTGPDIGSDHLPLVVDVVAVDDAHRVNSAE